MNGIKKNSNLSTNVEINLGNDFVTDKSAANMLLSIVKFLLFNRNQIPFVYETFYYMTKQLEKAKVTQSENGVNNSFVKNYAMERQCDVAIQTYRKFNEISDILIKSFEKNEIEQAIIMFGATTFTSKEAFIVTLPDISKNHFAANHPNLSEMISRKVIRSIVTSKNFFDVNYSELKPTNMYVILRPKYSMNNIGEDFKHHSAFKLPTSCRTTHINITNNSTHLGLNCCRSLSIFSDTETSNHISIMEDDLKINGKSKTPEVNNGQTTEVQTGSTSCNRFYECNTIVRGFKDQLIKGQCIWTHQSHSQ